MFMSDNIIASSVKVKGLVQGVGFRPFIYRLAKKHHLNGNVKNNNEGVEIHIEGAYESIENFISSLKIEAPKASQISSVIQERTNIQNLPDFKIIKSRNQSVEITEISPDISVCDNCLADMKIQHHRINYPFINCTNCGPRFTIIKDLPYDRDKTTMQIFSMCNQCKSEYTDILNRRFHAQPVACNNCGPHYELITDNERIENLSNILTTTSRQIDNGEIIAVKGLGGFHLACDALNEESVSKLRIGKNRDGKPFAVLFRNIEELTKYAYLNKKEKELLTSWRKPIVLVKAKKKLARDVCVEFNTIGAMLPYMPIHYLLFEKLKTPVIVLTSGNISEEPIIINNKDALNNLNKITNNFLLYNREIHNRTDDSVATVVNNKERLIRRSRGYVPNPVYFHHDVDGILSTGAELVNCFCIGKQSQAILSQHIGDLKNIETLEFFEESISRFKKLFRVKPSLIACDLHPDYLSTRWAKEQNLPVVQIQHHHAHIASCMAEHQLDEPVIGIAMDGIGMGEDGNIWGGEFLIADINNYSREYHFEYIPMPGGDAATHHPWRMAVAYLRKFFKKEINTSDTPAFGIINSEEMKLVNNALKNKINTPLTSSAGRLFDAVSAITGLCLNSSFHAEAPMRLENEIDRKINASYSFEVTNKSISFQNTFAGIIDDINNNIPVSVISAKFHNTIINVIFTIVEKLCNKTGIKKVVLSGGTFQNRYLLQKSEELLSEEGYQVYTHSKIPSNDGGIALGQLAVAAKRRKLKCV